MRKKGEFRNEEIAGHNVEIKKLAFQRLPAGTMFRRTEQNGSSWCNHSYSCHGWVGISRRRYSEVPFAAGARCRTIRKHRHSRPSLHGALCWRRGDRLRSPGDSRSIDEVGMHSSAHRHRRRNSLDEGTNSARSSLLALRSSQCETLRNFQHAARGPHGFLNAARLAFPADCRTGKSGP